MTMQQINRRMFIMLTLSVMVTGGIFAYEHYQIGGGSVRTEPQPQNEISSAVDPQSEDRGAPIHAALLSSGSPASTPVRFTIQSVFEPRQPDTYQIATENFRGYRVQFENCVATDPFIGGTFKSGTELMLESKSPDTQIIYLGAQQITLGGNDFAFVKLPKVTHQTTYLIDCQMSDSMQYNIATIMVYP